MTDAPDPDALARAARRFGIDAAASPLGAGGEAVVFALDAARVLRLYRRARGAYVARLASFLDCLEGVDWPFATPRVLEHGSVDSVSYSIDRRIPGRGLDRVLPSVSEETRRRLLEDYVDAALRLREAEPPARDFGELLADRPVRRDSWPAFLRDRAAQSLGAALPDLQSDLPSIDRVIAAFDERLDLVADVREPALVHGDYFPGNVLADADGVTGVIDFGPITVAGDWRMDAAGALCFLEVIRDYRAGDSAVVRARLEARAPSSLPVIDLYRTYYALYFSFTKRDSPRLYAWCLRALRAVPTSG